MGGYFIGQTDIGMTLDGDIMVSSNGDFMLVDGFEWLYREVNKRIRTTNPSWILYPTYGASMDDFQGQPNTEAVAQEIRRRLVDVLSRDNIGYPGEFSVLVVPTSIDGIAVFIYLDIAGNRTEISKLIYEYSNGVVQPLEPNNHRWQPVGENKLLEQETRKGTGLPNKYQQIIDNAPVL